MKDADLRSVERLEIYSDLIKAYFINMGKAVIFIVFLFALFFALEYFSGTNPFLDMFDTLGIPLLWVTRAIMISIGFFLVISLLNTTALTSNGLVFQGDTLTYSYGSFFKVTKSTPISNITRVNYKKYGPLKLGDIMVEITGTEEALIKVQYVSDVKYKCELINKLANLKKAENSEEVREKGVL
jgi:hypothetical protein